MFSSCGEGLRRSCGIERIPFHSKHHNLLEHAGTMLKSKNFRLIEKTPLKDV